MARSSRKIGPTGIGMALVGGIVVVILVAMFVASDYRPSYRGFDKIDDYEPMESRGKWLGLYLSDTKSRDARALRVPPHVKGVVVTGMKEPAAGRARYGGVRIGDVITGIDGKKVKHLKDVHKISKRLDPRRPVMLDVLQGGQPMIKVIPAVSRSMVGVAWQPTRLMQWPSGWYGGAVGSYWGVASTRRGQPYIPTAYVPPATSQPYVPVARVQPQPYAYGPYAVPVALQRYQQYAPPITQPYVQYAPRTVARMPQQYAVPRSYAYPYRR